jgi:hypothetical protein
LAQVQCAYNLSSTFRRLVERSPRLVAARSVGPNNLRGCAVSGVDGLGGYDTLSS